MSQYVNYHYGAQYMSDYDNIINPLKCYGRKRNNPGKKLCLIKQIRKHEHGRYPRNSEKKRQIKSQCKKQNYLDKTLGVQSKSKIRHIN